MRCTLSFSLICSAIMCIRGSRSTKHHVKTPILCWSLAHGPCARLQHRIGCGTKISHTSISPFFLFHLLLFSYHCIFCHIIIIMWLGHFLRTSCCNYVRHVIITYVTSFFTYVMLSVYFCYKPLAIRSPRRTRDTCTNSCNVSYV